MSFGGTGVGDVIRVIEGDVGVGVVEARFWQVHHGLGMASLKVGVAGSVVDEAGERVRERVVRLVRDRMGGMGVRWEVSVGLSTAVA